MLERGLSIPDDIAVVGFDNIERCTEARIPLTTVESPREKIGNIAFQRLMDMISEGHTSDSERILLEPKLVVRESA